MKKFMYQLQLSACAYYMKKLQKHMDKADNICPLNPKMYTTFIEMCRLLTDA